MLEQDKLTADASTRGIQERTRRRRRLRASSLLATGGAGDTSGIVTGTPAAIAKPTLGA